MSEDEYVVINKTQIQQRIEELERIMNSEKVRNRHKSALRYEYSISELENVLSKSTPLISKT